jgi:signal peptidase I
VTLMDPLLTVLATVTLAAVLAGIAGYVEIRRRWLVATVVGNSMLPTMRPGDRVLVRRRRAVAVGDVVVIHSPTRAGGGASDPTRMVKRVSGLEGDRLPDPPGGVVPPGMIAVLGDNGGYDSRTFGPLPCDLVIGVVVRSLPANRKGSS